MSENLGNTMIDGKIIDLDKVSVEELKKIDQRLSERESKIREEIDKLLEDN